MEKVIEHFFIHSMYLTIASNKQRQEHNNLVTIRRENLKGAHERSRTAGL